MKQTEKQTDLAKHVMQRTRAPGGGRPSIDGFIGAGKSRVYQMRVTSDQYTKIISRGGVAWLRKLIDAA